MNAYLWSERISAIFDASLFQNITETKELELANFPKKAKIVRYGLHPSEVKSCLLTTKNEIHWSNVNCRTLRKRWDAAKI
ncbi:MAG: hypothetical protein GY801_03560 [bacterium]|nr:hypothetical protein [bacterium]